MWKLALLPFFLQAIAIGIDEAVFHVRRGLPLWERIGHPIDTFSVILCMGYVLFVPFSTKALIIYAILAAFSCLLVTKDEFIHKEHCPGAENWLHALLFTLHPITLTMAGLLWPVVQGSAVPSWMEKWLSYPEALSYFLQGQFGAMIFFFFYQIIFWNIIWKNKPVIKH